MLTLHEHKTRFKASLQRTQAAAIKIRISYAGYPLRSDMTVPYFTAPRKHSRCLFRTEVTLTNLEIETVGAIEDDALLGERFGEILGGLRLSGSGGAFGGAAEIQLQRAH